MRPERHHSRKTSVTRRRRRSRRCGPVPCVGFRFPAGGRSPQGGSEIARRHRPVPTHSASLPGRKDVSAERTGWPSGRIGTQVLLTPPTLSRLIRITSLHLYRKTKKNKATIFLCIKHNELTDCFTFYPQNYSQDAMSAYSLSPSLFGKRSRRRSSVLAWARRRRAGRVVSGRNGSRVVDPVHSSNVRS